MGYAREGKLGGSAGRFREQGETGPSLWEPNVPFALPYGLDDFGGYLFARNIDREPHTVKPLEGFARRPVVFGLGKHVRGNRPQFHKGRTDRQAAEVGLQPEVKCDSAAFDAE